MENLPNTANNRKTYTWVLLVFIAAFTLTFFGIKLLKGKYQESTVPETEVTDTPAQ